MCVPLETYMTMRQLNRIQSLVFVSGGILMTAGAGCYAFLLMQDISSVAFLAGALAFALMQARQTYDGVDLTIRRLRKIMLAADVLFVVSGILAFEEQYGFIRNMLAGKGDAYVTFVGAAYGKWVVLLLIAAVLELYTTHRISGELDKKNAEKTLKE